MSAVGELVNSLDKQRIDREVTLALHTGIRDARAEFSFLRVRGLRFLLKSLRSMAQSDSSIILFFHTQSIPDLQVVPVLFEHSLKETEDDSLGSLDHIFGVEPMKINSPSTDAEVALALRVLEGCCLLHPESTCLAHQHKAIPVEMRRVLASTHRTCKWKAPMATIHEDVRRLLGEKSASSIWAASRFGPTLDPDQRLTSLHIQARRALESIDLY